MTLDEVSSLRHESSRQGVFTEFDFAAGDIRQRWVKIPGHQDIQPGMRITVVLGEPGNWQTLQAWRFDDRNKVVVSISPVADLIYLCLLCLATLVLLWLLLVERNELQIPVAALAFGTFVVASGAGGMYFELQNSRAVMKLLASSPRQRP
ncbi:hypothetical protein K6V72_08930 [Ralstonia insidiosa]|uniref:Uncharacterized protein n=1 Tax=Ralstonia insidiosa TaxID=190721 RepID=A0A192A184_9RALS|nr:hypothetical protein [Ralstonia insidiosa]ANJ74144.1 hypothetical protein A9Y76_17550 [Ralstonia insidiosa]KAB0471361.1 hypothetical protein F7R11_01800 [Ralstonia insidiosa]MBY4909112.1 hypothetical protein [Ralstonia insidiosa]